MSFDIRSGPTTFFTLVSGKNLAKASSSGRSSDSLSRGPVCRCVFRRIFRKSVCFSVIVLTEFSFEFFAPSDSLSDLQFAF